MWLFFGVFFGLSFPFMIYVKEVFGVRNFTRFNAPDSFPNYIHKPYKSLEAVDNYSNYSDELTNYGQGRHKDISFGRRVRIFYSWGKWERWTKCNGSCVQIRRRPCIESIQNDTVSSSLERIFYPDVLQNSVGCIGTTMKFRLCKDEKCNSNKYLRDEQCETFNTTPFKGKFYNWKGFEKEHNECELFCKPADSDMFVSMNVSVTDGSPCEKPAVYYTHAYRRGGVCVEGICKAVHSTGAIRPVTTRDSRLRCGSVLCRVVAELFIKPKLSYGYNYVATIAAGAMNVSIKQMAKSDNLLALKTTNDIFIINGNRRDSESGIFEYSGDDYEYNRDQGTIATKGPLNKAVELLLFVRGHNSGVKYEYTMPVSSEPILKDEGAHTQWNELGQPLDVVDTASIEGGAAYHTERKRRKFSWKLLGFGQCNRSCGPGFQEPIFRCIRESMSRYYSQKRCADVEKPTFSDDIYQCNRGLCPAFWRTSDYSKCQCDSNDVKSGEVRTRILHCVQEQINGRVEEVEEAMCAGEKMPELTETCDCPRQLRRNIYASEAGEHANTYARFIDSPSTVRNVHLNSTRPARRQFRDDRIEKSGVWLMSDWNQECAAECPRIGYEHRSIYCDRTAPYKDVCDLRYTPEQKRRCSSPPIRDRECRRGIWFASEWTNCTGDCFHLQQSRIVLCLLQGIVVDAGECEADHRPDAIRNCTHEEVNYCGPKWHYSEWSECSRSCGVGIQRRYIKCLEYDWTQNALVESKRCRYQEREPVYGSCNEQRCEELDGNRYILPNDMAIPDADCGDEFANCKRINRSRLCKFQYYKIYCCHSCRESN